MAANNLEPNIKLKKHESKITEIYKNSLDAIFELFDKILEDPVENLLYECISITFGYFQLIVYIIDETFWPIWDQNNLISEIRGVSKYSYLFPFIKINKQIYSTMIAILICFIFILMILIISISYFLKQNIKVSPIFIIILKYFLPFFSNFLFGQFFLLLILIFDCQDGHAYVDENLGCREGSWYYTGGVFCVIAIIFLLIIAYITNSLYCKSIYEKSNSDVLKKSNTVPDITLLLTKIIIPTTFILDKGEESEHWALLSFIIFITGINAYITFVYRNRENKFLNLLNIIFALILNVGFDTLFIGKIFKKWGFNGAIYLFFIGVISIVLFVLIRNRKDLDFIKINYKSIEKSEICLKYIKQTLDIISNKNNYRNNNLLLNTFITNIESNCLEADCPLKKYIKNLEEGIEYNFFLYQFCDKVFTYAINKFPYYVSLKMFYVIFLLTKLNNKKKAKMIYDELQEYDYFLSDGFKYFKLTKYFKAKDILDFNNFNSIEYKNNVIKFKELVEKTTFLYHRFWSLLLMSKIKGKHDFIEFNKIATKILKLIEKTDDDYNSLIKIKNDNIELIQLYGEFIQNILNNKNKYEEHKEYLNNLTYNDKQDDFNNVDFTNFFINILDGKDLFKYIVISAETKTLGTILKVSTNSCPILGYKKCELIGKNINILIPECLRNSHDIVMNLKTQNLKLNFYENSLQNKNYSPEFLEKIVFAISKSKYLIPLKLKIYLVSTEEGRLVYIIEIIKEYYFFVPNNVNEQNNDNEMSLYNFYKYCCVLTDENCIIQYFTPNSCELLQLNYNDINANHNIMSYIRQLYDEYISLIRKRTTNKEQSKFQNTEISFQDKLKIQDKIKNYNLENDINFMQFYSSELGRKKTQEIINQKFSLKRKITWKKVINGNHDYYSFKQSLINFNKDDDTTLSENNSNNFNYEKELYMKIKKIKMQNQKIGYLFLFKKCEDNKMLSSFYNDDSNINKPKNEKSSKNIPSRKLVKQKTEKMENKISIDFEVKNENKQRYLDYNHLGNVHKSSNFLKTSLDDILDLNKNYIPNNEFTFEFNVNSFSYKPTKISKENDINFILRDQAMYKLNQHNKEINENKNNIEFSESNDSESDSESNEESSSYSETSHSNISPRNNKRKITIMKQSNIENKNVSKKKLLTFTHISNKNISNMSNIYYKVNLNKVKFMLYDFNREMLIDLTEKTEKISQVEIAISNIKSEIQSGKDEKYSILNKQNIINKTDKKEETNTNNNNNPICNKINEQKSLETHLSEAINKKERNKSFIIFQNIFILFFIIIVVSVALTEYFSAESYSILYRSLELIKNIISVRYANVIGIYYLRELTLLNINISSCAINYDSFPAKNKTAYKSLIKSEILELFKESQSKMRKIVSSNFPFTANTTLYLTQMPINISILLPHFVIEKIEFNYLSALVMMHSVYFNLASSSTTVQQNQTDLFTYIHNSFNSIGTELKTLIELFRAQLNNKIKSYKMQYIIVVIVIFLIFLAFYLIVIYFYLLSIKAKINYVSLFFGVDIYFVKSSVSKCEKYLLKLKYESIKNSNNYITGNFENEVETNLIDSKEKISNNDFLNKNKNKNFNQKTSINDIQRDKTKNITDLNDHFFIILFGIIVLIFYLYFLIIVILFCRLLEKTKNLSIFIYHFQHYQLSIIELFNTYREFLFDEKSTLYGMLPFEYLTTIEDEIYDTRNDDTLYMQKYKNLLQPVDLSFVAKDLCSFYQTDYFNSSAECIETMGVSLNYEFPVFVSHFVEQIRTQKYIVVSRLEKGIMIGNLTEYDVENWTAEKLNISCESHKSNTFRTRFFNSEDTHSKLNVKFMNVLLPYININRKVLLKGVSINGELKIFSAMCFFFAIIIIVIVIFYLIPTIQNLYNAIHKTKKMLKLIPIYVLAGQSNIETLLNISN